ncbi:hypothetical protein GCM10022393_38390 [Aquimarina addita]|uniref:Response regulatory domain-containing protein n=1 Tax=Aquimarina addita TaxID=870485 RepID=A0ABP6UWD7_9FLAO
MFRKILLAEDLGSISHGIAQILEERSGIKEIQQSQYCDEAYLKFRKAFKDGKPFELLITDLSFKDSHRDRELTSGVELIKAVKEIKEDTKIIMYSMEDRPAKIKSFFADYQINAFVNKGRNGLNELIQSVREVFNDNSYLSPALASSINKNNSFELKDYDVLLLKHLAKGLTQEEIGVYFKKQRISPSSTSSIEKRLNALKFNFKAKNAVHLISMTKDLGLL